MNHKHTVDIFNIPLALQQEMLGSWLTIKDVANMDNAVCSRENRPLFLKLLSNQGLVLINQDISNENIVSWMTWIVTRKVSVSSCRLSKVVTYTLYEPFFACTGRRLETLTIVNVNWKNKDKTSQILNCAAAVCSNLKEISLKDCSSVRGLDKLLIASQKTICKLTLYDCDLSGFQLGDCELPVLQLLSVHLCCEVNNSTLKQLIQSSHNLETLSCSITSKGFVDVVFSPHLREISLIGSDITNAMFCSMVHSCPLLEVVQLNNCYALTDVSVVELVQHAKHLTSLYLSDNMNVTDTALEAITVHCGERLRHLCLYHYHAMTTAGLQQITEHCHHLEGLEIILFRNEHITIPAIEALLQSNPLLQEVSISCQEDSDALMATITNSCPQLRYLDISLLCGYTEEGIITALMSASTTLRTVAVSHHCTIIRQLMHSSWNKQYRPDVKLLYQYGGRLPFWKQYRY